MWKSKRDATTLLIWSLCFIVLQQAHSAHSFLTKPTPTGQKYHHRVFTDTDFSQRNRNAKTKTTPLQIPRGGSELNMQAPTPKIIESVLYPCLQTGPYGVVGLTAVAAAAVVPLTLYKTSYAISVGYGAAIFLIGLAAQLAFPTSPGLLGQALVGALMFYGLRLSSYLFLREKTRKTPPAQAMNESTVPKKLSLALSVSLFYAFLTTPALYALRNMDALLANPTNLLITQGGLVLAAFGAILEAVADLQKYLVKQSSKGDDDKTFEGPTEWSYRICRHPNYLGEVLYWLGIFVSGAPTFGTNVIPWVSSILGLYGIVSIMRKATERLESRQQEKYGNQEKYKTWSSRVKAPLFPFLS